MKYNIFIWAKHLCCIFSEGKGINKMTKQQKISSFMAFTMLVLGYNNCGQVKFSGAQNTTLGAVAPLGTPAPIPLQCSQGQISNGTACVPCQSYVALQPDSSGNYTIPAQDDSATCYYAHLIDAVDMSGAVDSNTWQTFDTAVVARHHVTANESSIVLNNMIGPNGHSNYYPRVIGSSANSNGSVNTGAISSSKFTLLGNRAVTLSGDFKGSTAMLVDNFILLQTSSSKGSWALAEGSSDALPWLNPTNANDATTTSITLNGAPVTYSSFATGGTSELTPNDLSQYFPINSQVSLFAEGLDCGGIGQISDIYILFQ
jgi:hypothetical protein